MIGVLTRHMHQRATMQDAAYGKELLQFLDYAAFKAQNLLAGGADRSLVKVKLLTICQEIEKQLPADPIARADIQGQVRFWRDLATG